MAPIKPGEFADFFRALHDDGRTTDFGPFPWQRRLAEQVASDPWPDVLDLPTASGKTACIDIAIFALVCQADLLASERTAPRRIFFVVDRRVIVDAAYDRALGIAKRLREGLDARGQPSEILGRVARALRKVGALEAGEDPLACFQLRGGVYRDQAWTRTPTQPTVIASTVDQVGSRLLFRGYGVSDSLQPIHAGLAGNDALILLDEAHCAIPFLQTARAIGDYRRLVSSKALPPPPFHVAVLSATPPGESDVDGEALRSFGLDAEDREPKHLGRRLAASKLAELIEPINVPLTAAGTRKFATAIADQARRLADADKPRAVAVFVNRVETAKEVYGLLKRERGASAVLMIGRMRPIDRDDLVARWEAAIRSGANRDDLEQTVYVVATQCLEVGADFDFDALVTECASLDALRQRFGRLNRLGRAIEARAAILIRADQAKDGAKPDPIYGEALARTWSWLRKRSTPTPTESDEAVPIVDFGIDALAHHLRDAQEVLKDLRAPALEAPVMLPAHIDCWVQTAPRPAPDPDPALFLHGPGRGRPEIQVCWRDDLLGTGDRIANWRDIISLCPPVAAECMRVPLHLARAWLDGKSPGDDADLEHAPAVDPETSDPVEPKTVLLWCGPDDDRTDVIKGGEDLRPGDTVVVPVTTGGRDMLGHVPEAAESTIDIAERAYRAAGRRAVLRLHPRVMARWPGGSKQELLALVNDPDDALGRWADLREALRDLAAAEGFPDDLAHTINQIVGDKRRPEIVLHPDRPATTTAEEKTDRDEFESGPWGGLVLLGRRRLEPKARTASEESETSEDDSASESSEPVTLDKHTNDVEEFVVKFARACGLPAPLEETLRVAARWHDLGKADSRFQNLLHHGDIIRARLAPELLAKSGGVRLSKSQRDRARRRSGFPDHGRHELLSVRLVEPLRDRLDPAIDCDLVIHLITSHHGHARPFVPFSDGLEPGSPPTEGEHLRQLAGLALEPFGDGQPFEIQVNGAGTPLHRLDGGPAERFWALVRRYGWWGLAWLEAILRLADHRASEREQEPEDFRR